MTMMALVLVYPKLTVRHLASQINVVRQAELNN